MFKVYNHVKKLQFELLFDSNEMECALIALMFNYDCVAWIFTLYLSLSYPKIKHKPSIVIVL